LKNFRAGLDLVGG